MKDVYQRPYTVSNYIAREREVRRCIKQSSSVVIGKRWIIKLFSAELQAMLKTATITIGKNAILYDWRPDLKGCSQATREYDNYNKEVKQ